MLPISSTPSTPAGKRFTRGFPAFGAAVGVWLKTKRSIINKTKAIASMITLIRLNRLSPV
jgi:hypothetical protein